MSIKEQWMGEHREAIEKEYPRFVRNIEKHNKAIEQKVVRRNELMASHKPVNTMTEEERFLFDFNPTPAPASWTKNSRDALERSSKAVLSAITWALSRRFSD